MWNPFSKKPKTKDSSLFSTLANYTDPYRSSVEKPAVTTPAKPKIRKPYKLPVFGYAVIAFVSLIVAGAVADLIRKFLPAAEQSSIAAEAAFIFVAVLSGYRAATNWKH